MFVQQSNFMEKQKLIQARKQRGVTQRQMADVLCMDVSNYNRKEKGKLSMRIKSGKK